MEQEESMGAVSTEESFMNKNTGEGCTRHVLGILPREQKGREGSFGRHWEMGVKAG